MEAEYDAMDHVTLAYSGKGASLPHSPCRILQKLALCMKIYSASVGTGPKIPFPPNGYLVV
ncbi:hypothetical protein ACI01nite_00800 [Acetobacter cibinongensis]|uniref:Uncharacterized protein n=1 Tax=Acetobacter cibinongensis TaxID=146475 RepID=A0A0D6N0X7_9PROT|nr:hypothetical protein Abci_006_068 [Acetobacter cibinongensis]GBQ16172.1 hypothetical protein AA0482_1453 [Acetobacter cibinongensis NRIC 0482]GEL57478.1 hypothetical protein ACI01nite_00800 [Acetobacter cibinongensis]